MAGTPSLFAGIGAQFFDDNGVILSGGKIFTYEAGTTTPVATYTTEAANVAHSNPIILDAAGRVPTGEIWLKEGDQTYYKFVLKDANDVLIATYDFVPGTYTALDLGNTTDPAKGDALVGFKQSNSSGVLSGAVGRTVHQKLQEFISVKDFGATGDGVTNDTAAIQTALNLMSSQGGGYVVAPYGTYVISGTLRIKANVVFDLKASKLKMTNTTDTVVLETGAFINNGTITAQNITNYVGPMLLVDDSDGYRRGPEFGAENLTLIGPGAGASATGTAFYAHGTSTVTGYGITRGRFNGLSISNFSKGVHLYSEISWVTDLRFNDFYAYGCEYFIYLQKGALEVSGNVFEGIIQPNTTALNNIRAIYDEGYQNTFSGQIWDWTLAKAPAVEYAESSRRGLLQAMVDARLIKTANVDVYYAPLVTTWSGDYQYFQYGVRPPSTSETGTFSGSDDVLAYADRIYTTTWTGDAVTSGSLNSVFRPDSNVAAWTNLNSATVKIDLGSTKTYLTAFGAVFGFGTAAAPKYADSFLVETSLDDVTYNTIFTTTTNKNYLVGIAGKSFLVGTARYIRITIANTTPRDTTLQRLFMYSGDGLSNVYYSKGGGTIYGDIGFYNAPALAKQTITGSKGGNAALADLLTKLAALGLITDSTT